MKFIIELLKNNSHAAAPLKKFLNKYRFVFVVFIVWRTALFLIGLLSFNILPFKASFPYIPEMLTPTGLPQYIWHWANFDGVHYLSIAKYGYGGLVGNEQVFFPLYPILIRLLGGSLIAGLLISNLCALGSGLLLQKYFGRWAVLFFYTFPTAFFLGSVYNESLFIFLILLTFMKSKFFGIFAALTRLTGVFAGFFGGVGLMIYMFFLQINFNNPLMFFFNQGGFGNARASSFSGLITPFQTVFRYLKIFLYSDWSNYAIWIALLELICFVFAVILLTHLTFRRKMPFSWLFLCWAIIIIPSLTGTLLSMPRFILTVFPIYVFLGGLNFRLKIFLAGIFVILQAILTTMFLRGYFVA